MAYHIKEIIISVTVLVICILLIRRVFRKEIGSRLPYALWLLVALRLVIPISIPVSLPMDALISQHHLMMLDTDDVVEQLEKPIQVTVNSRSGLYHLLAEDSAGMTDSEVQGSGESGIIFMAGHLRYSWLDVLGTIWTLGMFVIASWIVITNLIFYRRLKRNRSVLHLSAEEEAALRGKLSQKIIRMYDHTTIYVVTDLVSPCLYGLPGREAVYLTPDLTEDRDRLCHVLTHELCHKRHGDGFWGILRGLLVTVYWFHPFVWAAAIVSKRDCELACDETALMFLGEEERICYGETLLSIITRKARLSDLVCTATTMTGGGKSVKERIGFIVKEPKVLRAAVAAVIVLMAVVCVFAFTRDSGETGIVVFDSGMDTVTGADMQIPLPDCLLGVCGQVTEKGKDDVIIYHIESGQEVGRFCRMRLKDALQLVDEGKRVVPLGDYGDNALLKAYLGGSSGYLEITQHTYTPAGQEADGVHAVPGTDSNTETEYVNEDSIYHSADAGSETYIPAPEETDSYTIFLPYEEGQSLDAQELAEDSGAHVDYLPTEEIVTTVYPAKEVNVDELSHTGCYVYVKADYDKVENRYLEEIEKMNEELEAVAEEVIVLSLNGEIREELLNQLTENRTPYVGNNVKVAALINALPVPSSFNYRGDLSLQTKQEPYSLRFEYEMTRDSIPQEDLDMLYFNAAMLFYAIGNVDEITMYVRHPVGSPEASSLYSYERKDMEELFEGLSAADYENGELFRQQLEDLHVKVVEYLRSRGQ